MDLTDKLKQTQEARFVRMHQAAEIDTTIAALTLQRKQVGEEILRLDGALQALYEVNQTCLTPPQAPPSTLQTQ